MSLTLIVSSSDSVYRVKPKHSLT